MCPRMAQTDVDLGRGLDETDPCRVADEKESDGEQDQGAWIQELFLEPDEYGKENEYGCEMLGY